LEASCLDSYATSDFSSRRQMESAGWVFSWDDDFAFKPDRDRYAAGVPEESYWGFEEHGAGALSLELRSRGMLALDFGNSLDDDSSKVVVSLNGLQRGEAGGNTLAKLMQIPFRDGDLITIAQAPTGVIVINSIVFRCTGAAETSTSTTRPAAAEAGLDEDSVLGQRLAAAALAEAAASLALPEESAESARRSGQLLAAARGDLDRRADPAWRPEAREAPAIAGETGWARPEEAKEEPPAERQAQDSRGDLVEDAFEEEKEVLMHAIAVLMGSPWGDDAAEANVSTSSAKNGTRSGRNGSAEPSGRNGSAGPSGRAGSARPAGRNGSANASRRNGSAKHSGRNGSTSSSGSKPGDANETAAADHLRDRQSQALAAHHELQSAKSLGSALEELHRRHQQQAAEHERDGTSTTGEGEDADEGGGEEEAESVLSAMTRYSPSALRQEQEAQQVSLFCFSLMMPFGYEPALLEAQKSRRVGIFDCDEYSVFSNMTDTLSDDSSLKEKVEILPASLAVVYGGRWNTALNTDIFNRVWLQIVKLGRYRFHDWSVKADPDCVFFPARLKELLALTKPMSGVPRERTEPEHISCSACRMVGHEGDTCAAHVKSYQRQGRSCTEALELVAREPPQDCGCTCDDMACEEPEEAAMYLNNCKWGLHGPLEVLSRRAVAAYVSGLPQCTQMRQNPWGEDKFMDSCMAQLGVVRTNQYRLLSETACGEHPAPCGSADVAFHPFKSIQSYFSCWGFADKYGHGPADPRGSWEDGDGRMGVYYLSRDQELKG